MNFPWGWQHIAERAKANRAASQIYLWCNRGEGCPCEANELSDDDEGQTTGPKPPEQPIYPVLRVRQSLGCGGHATNHIPLFTVDYRFVSELLDRDEDAHTITDLLDPHLLENLLITLDEVVAIEVVRYTLSAS